MGRSRHGPKATPNTAVPSPSDPAANSHVLALLRRMSQLVAARIARWRRDGTNLMRQGRRRTSRFHNRIGRNTPPAAPLAFPLLPRPTASPPTTSPTERPMAPGGATVCTPASGGGVVPAATAVVGANPDAAAVPGATTTTDVTSFPNDASVDAPAPTITDSGSSDDMEAASLDPHPSSRASTPRLPSTVPTPTLPPVCDGSDVEMPDAVEFPNGYEPSTASEHQDRAGLSHSPGQDPSSLVAHAGGWSASGQDDLPRPSFG